jgi:FKBP-type peptidyl-prolyl cis-trans isomerase FkpA
MKQTIFTFLLLASILVSCRKDKYEPGIVQYDDDQIKAYISANGLTGMVKDTSGIYYKVINPGTGAAIQYTDSISMVFTVRSFDAKYVSADTLANHFENFSAHLLGTVSPLGLNNQGLQFAIHTLINHKGGIARLLIPSHLAYGVPGVGSGSSTLTNGRINGNQCLDYYVHIIGDQDAYDQMIIRNYITTGGLTSSMKQDPSGIWYSISTPGTGTVAITDNSTISATYTLSMLNATIIDQYNSDPPTSIDLPDLIIGMQIGLKKYATAGALMSFIIPSSLAYGKVGNGVAPPNSVIRYDIQVDDVTP